MHHAQRARARNLEWIARVIKSQNEDVISLSRFRGLAAINRGVSRDKFMEYLQVLEDLGEISIDAVKDTITITSKINNNLMTPSDKGNE